MAKSQTTKTNTSKKSTAAKSSASSKKSSPAKKSGSKKTGSRGGTSTKAKDAQLRRSNQLFAVILFALGILLTLIALFNGPAVWGACHQILRGIFGPISYAVGPICIAVSLMIALERTHAEVHLRVWELVALMVLLCGITQFFCGYPAGESFFDKIVNLYINGTNLKSGGLMAMITGWPLLRFTGSKGSLVIHLLGLFILIMAVTGATLRDLLNSLRSPVRQLKENYEDQQEIRQARAEARAQMMEEKETARAETRASRLEEKKQQAVIAEQAGRRYNDRFNIDVPISEEESKRSAENKRKEVASKAVSAAAKKDSSAQGLEDALQMIKEPSAGAKASAEKPVEEKKDVRPDEQAAASPAEEKHDAAGQSLDAIIAAFKKKPSPAAPPVPNPAPAERDVPDEPEFTETSVSAAAADPAVGDAAPAPVEEVPYSSANPAGVGETIAELLDGQPPLPEEESTAPDDLPFDLDEPERLAERMNSAIQEIRREEPAPEAVSAPEEPDNAAAEPEPPAEEAAPKEEIYRMPPVTLLRYPKKTASSVDVSEELKFNAERIVETLKSFGVQTRLVDITRGPTVTRYELQPSAGVKVSKITSLADDIALNLASKIRIEAPIPGKPAVGIEVPNKVNDTVSLREAIDSEEFANAKGALPAAFGRDIAGQVIVGDVAAMTHTLIAGTTGSGKSVCVNSILISFLYRFAPKDLRVIMVDPKQVEMVVYNGIPHLLVPVVTDPKKAAGALGWAVNEMERRYTLLGEHSVRNITGYKKLVQQREENPDPSLPPLEPMPYIVIVIDELADLMVVARKAVEEAIMRIAQKGRAAGIHLIVATQRPSVDVVTGVIKANLPSRIALTVSSQVDSRTIIDAAGAEKLLGHGDMLYAPIGKTPVRVQGCYVSDEEVEDVVNFIKSNLTEEVEYDARILEEIEQRAADDDEPKKGKGGDNVSSSDSDPLIMEAVDVVLDAGQASTSYLQRRLKVGYARAARLMDELEDRGIVGPQDGSKPRELLITRSQWAEIKDRMENL